MDAAALRAIIDRETRSAARAPTAGGSFAALRRARRAREELERVEPTTEAVDRLLASVDLPPVAIEPSASDVVEPSLASVAPVAPAVPSSKTVIRLLLDGTIEFSPSDLDLVIAALMTRRAAPRPAKAKRVKPVRGGRPLSVAVPMSADDDRRFDYFAGCPELGGSRSQTVRDCIHNLAWLIRYDNPREEPDCWVGEGRLWIHPPPRGRFIEVSLSREERDDVDLLSEKLGVSRGLAALAAVRHLHHVYLDTT